LITSGNEDGPADYWTVDLRPSGNAPTLGPLADTVEEMLAVVASGRCMCITALSLAQAYPRPGIAWVPITDISPSSSPSHGQRRRPRLSCATSPASPAGPQPR